MNAVFGTPASALSHVVEREHLLDVVPQLVDGDVVALVVHAVRSDARAQVRLVAAALRAPRRGPRRATGSTTMFGEVARALLVKPSFTRMSGMSFANASAVGYFFRVIASSSASVYLPARRKPSYQMSNGSSGRPSRFSISFATRGTSGEASDLLEHRLDARLGHLAVDSKRRAIRRRRGRRVRIRVPRRVEGREQLRVARVGLALRW